jgi:hypothetical protein
MEEEMEKALIQLTDTRYNESSSYDCSKVNSIPGIKPLN